MKGITDQGDVYGLCLDSNMEFTIRSNSVVVAAGNSSAGIPQLSGELNWIQPVRGQLAVFEGISLVQRPIHFSDGYVIPRSNTSTVIGSVDRIGTFNTTPDVHGVLQLRQTIERTLPALRKLKIRDVIVGLRSKSSDKAPCLGHIRNSLFVATAHYRNGISLAAGTAMIMADLLCEDKHHDLLKSFRPSRFL